MAEIVFDHVTKMFDEQMVLDDISFRIGKRRVCVCHREKWRREEYPVKFAYKTAGTDKGFCFCVWHTT